MESRSTNLLTNPMPACTSPNPNNTNNNSKSKRPLVDHTYRDFSRYLIEGGEVEQHKKIGANFPAKLHKMLSDEECSHIINWMPHGRAFKILNKDLLVSVAVPKYLSQSKFESFTRQLSWWGFKRLHRLGPDHGCYYHECFLRDIPLITGLMRRPKSKNEKPLPDPEGEPNFYSISEMYPLPPIDDARAINDEFSGYATAGAHTSDESKGAATDIQWDMPPSCSWSSYASMHGLLHASGSLPVPDTQQSNANRTRSASDAQHPTSSSMARDSSSSASPAAMQMASYSSMPFMNCEHNNVAHEPMAIPTRQYSSTGTFSTKQDTSSAKLDSFSAPSRFLDVPMNEAPTASADIDSCSAPWLLDGPMNAAPTFMDHPPPNQTNHNFEANSYQNNLLPYSNSNYQQVPMHAYPAPSTPLNNYSSHHGYSYPTSSHLLTHSDGTDLEVSTGVLGPQAYRTQDSQYSNTGGGRSNNSDHSLPTSQGTIAQLNGPTNEACGPNNRATQHADSEDNRDFESAINALFDSFNS